MIRFACCIPGGSLMPEGVNAIPDSPAVQIVEKCRYLLRAGYDASECGGGMLASLNEAEWAYLLEENQKSPLALVAVNSLFPGDWKLSDPQLDKAPYLAYAGKLFDRMQALGIHYAVFGSGSARTLHPDALHPEAGLAESREALIRFMHSLAAEAGARGIQLLIEPLRRKETNIFVSVSEGGEAVRQLADENIRLLFDSFHMAEEGEDVADVRAYADLVRHCHISESPRRSIPGASDSSDLSYNRRFAEELLACGYDGVVSVECGFRDFRKEAAAGLGYLKEIFGAQPLFSFTAIRDLTEEPIILKPASGTVYAAITAVTDGVKTFPASPCGDGVIAVVTARRGETLDLIAVSSEQTAGCEAVVDGKKVEMKIGGNHFSDYVFDDGFKKPFFGPVTDDTGNAFTRLDLETKEHPHQRSVFVAVGDVNGVDCWNEVGNWGCVRNEAITDVYSGAAYASFTAKNVWIDQTGTRLIDESTSYTVYAQSEACRILDLAITFTASYGDVDFGNTKEAGPLGIRMRDELRSDNGVGRLMNSWGAVGENECWGRCAAWCDYYGEPEGIGPMGVTVFDNETNERYPTAWHIRAYGLFAANNLYFKGGFRIRAGESITYRYRILFRRKPMTTAELSDRYVAYTLQKS